jgi:hypothetical protein
MGGGMPTHSVEADARSTAGPVLPPDGTIIYVSEWRREILWIPVVVYGFLGICVIGLSLSRGSPLAAVVGALIFSAVVALSVQTAFRGVALSPQGVTARGWRTHRWSWGEIERFELLEQGRKMRFVVHLHNGKSHRFGGFLASSQEEEDRAQRIFQAMVQRLELEQTKAHQAP